MARLGRGLFYVLAIVVVLLTAGMLAPRPILAEPDSGQTSRRILVITNPIHTDIAIPLDADVRHGSRRWRAPV